MSHKRYHLQLNESEFGIHTVNFCTCLLCIGYGTHRIWDEGGDISPEENGGSIASFLEKNSLGLGKGGLYPLPLLVAFWDATLVKKDMIEINDCGR